MPVAVVARLEAPRLGALGRRREPGVQGLRRVEEEARERKEREREEMRRRAAAHKPDTEAWWLKYGAASSAGDKQREIGKLKARLQRFNKIASTSTAEGERENAERLAKQAAAKLETLQAAEQAAEAE